MRRRRSADGTQRAGERSWVFSWLLPFVVTSLASRHADAQMAPHIHLKGSSHVDVQVAREPGSLFLSGTVQDDAARPVPRANIRATFAPAANPRAPLHLAATDAKTCDGLDMSLEIEPSGGLAATADDSGRFCIRVALATDRYTAHVETRGSLRLDGTAIDVSVDLSLALVTLRFDPEPGVLSVDDESTSVEVVATIDDEKNASAAGLALSLSDERDSPLGIATTDALGRARFNVAATRLGLPGRGELRAAFAGNARTGAAMRTTPIKRRTHVDIALPDAHGDRLPVGSPEDGITLDVVATPRCVRHGCRAVPSGIIAAYEGGGSAMVGAAKLAHAEAHVVVRFAMPAEAFATPNGDEVPISMRYVPNDPSFLPGADVALVQPVRGRNVWSRAASAAPLLLAAAMVIALLAFGRLPFRSWNRRAKAGLPRPENTGGQVELLRGAPASQGWTGQVADAHDGRRIEHARLAIERPGFERSTVLAEAVSGGMGLFALPFVDARPGDELVVQGPFHAGLRRPLPPSGELFVALVLRKRALLDRLVAWARRRGPPYDQLPDPTPAHVRRSAGPDAEVARWADAVEQAAYGGAVIDEDAQADVEHLIPPDDR